jgi:hypothetical protein
VRARESDLSKKVADTKKFDPDQATQHFLKKYYTQDDGEMMDLKSAGLFEVDSADFDQLGDKAVTSEEEAVLTNE